MYIAILDPYIMLSIIMAIYFVQIVVWLYLPAIGRRKISAPENIHDVQQLYIQNKIDHNDLIIKKKDAIIEKRFAIMRELSDKSHDAIAGKISAEEWNETSIRLSLEMDYLANEARELDKTFINNTYTK